MAQRDEAGMRRAVSAKEAAELVFDGASVMIGGFSAVSSPAVMETDDHKRRVTSATREN